jgi:hypothetical protein
VSEESIMSEESIVSEKLTDETNDEPQNTENGRDRSAETTNFDTTTPSRIDPNVLITESQEQFSAICEELRREIKPTTYIERMYVDDLAAIIWEIMRMRRFKANLIRNAIQSALRDLIDRAKKNDNMSTISTPKEVLTIIAGWFGNKKDLARSQYILAPLHLDQNAVEAEAWRLASADLDRLERILTSLEKRRDKVLTAVAQYRLTLAQQLKLTAQRIIEADEVI